MVLLARVGDGIYNLLLILHLLAVVVAFSPAVVHALTGTRLLKEDEGAARRFFGVAAGNERTVYLPALLAVGILGFALVGVSGDVFQFSDPWVAVAAVLWLIIGGLVSAVIVPGERMMASGERSAESKVATAGVVATLLFVVVVFLMVVKPGQ